MLDKASKERIKQLKKDKKYDEIFVELGQKYYTKYVPNKVKKAELKSLKKEGRYEDIYNKYGEKKHDEVLINAMYKEIKEAKGIGKANIWRMKQAMLNIARALGIKTALAFLELSSVGALVTGVETMENSIKYESEIEDYNTNISNYANKVNSKELSDIQVFIQDSQIIMLNSDKENGIKFDAKEWSNATFFRGGIDGIINTAQESKENTNIELEEKVGEEKSFRESLKVDLDSIQESDQKEDKSEVEKDKNNQETKETTEIEDER